MAKAHRHSRWQHGVLLSTVLGLVATCLPDPSVARATRRLEAAASTLAGSFRSAEHPGRSLADQAQALEEQAGALYGTGRYEEALTAQRASVALHRRLAAQDPNQRLKLAASLHNLGVVLIRLGQKTGAIAPTTEALALYRHDPSSRDGAAAWALERPLRNLVLLHFEAQRPLEALPLADELVRLQQRAAAADPRAEAALMDVLNLRASLQVALNRPQAALRDLESAVALARAQAERFPDNPVPRHGLAGSLLNLSQVADLLDQTEQAVPPAREAEAVLAQLAREHPALRGDWAKALSRLGQAYARQGDAVRAQPSLERAVVVFRSLQLAGPTRTLAVEPGGYRDDLALTLETLAAVNQQRQRPREARAAGEEALRLYSDLAEGDPRYRQDVERTRAWLTSWPPLTPAQR
ncbi:MAG: tetratricopeptide repeat protein [Cyanobacteriota bacterium]|nr:tetratricopeptide repeat protein [Cyanobacteriota bacterium]